MVCDESLGDGLILRSVRDEADVARYIALNELVTGEGAIGERLLHHRPGTVYDDYLLVVDEHTGEAVSTTCLLPWRVCYEGVVLDVAMLEMVVTHPDYRRRGLVRAQVGRFHRMAAERGFDLCIIQGIPHYYRQYGYAYALDHTPTSTLPTSRVPEGVPGIGDRYRLRPATLSDAEPLAQLYDMAAARHQLFVSRSPDDWSYLLQWVGWPVRLVEDAGHAVGYLYALPEAGGRRVRVIESGIAGQEAAMSILCQLKAEALEEVRLIGPASNALVQVGHTLGSVPLPLSQWLWRIHSLSSFLAKIGPVLERRLDDAGCSGLAVDLCLNLFRHAIVLRFQGGRLCQVEDVGFVDASLGADGGDLCIPVEAFVRLALGYRSLDELRDAWPDIVVRPVTRYLLEALFPRMESWVRMPY